MATDLSIIIVSWNARQHLLNCLRSVADAWPYRQEIIVVDNASTDGSPEALEKQFPNIVLIKNQENMGFARANNIGIQRSSGRYLCLVNSDVIVLENCLNTLVEFMDENPSVGLAGPRILNPDRTLQPSCRHFPSLWNNLCQAVGLNHVFPKSAFFSEDFMRYWAHDEVRKVDVLSGCFWIARREAVEQVGFLDEEFFFYGEDVDWCKRFHLAGWGVVFYSEAEAIHFGGASSGNAPLKYFLELQNANLRYWRKHYGCLGGWGYTAISLLRHTLRLILAGIRYPMARSGRDGLLLKVRRHAASISWLFVHCVRS